MSMKMITYVKMYMFMYIYHEHEHENEHEHVISTWQIIYRTRYCTSIGAYTNLYRYEHDYVQSTSTCRSA
jgi:hypothetical protein